MERWYPGATPRMGPGWKVYSQPNRVEGACLHSMVGHMAAALGELDKQTRRASWCFSIGKDGTVLQHYPLDASTWHCGSEHWNTRLVGIEHEGGPQANPSEPLTTAQREASVRLVRWIAEQGGWTPSRDAPRRLWEHNEVSPTPTACPSGRIPWAAYVEEEPMSNAYLVTAGDTLGAIARRFGTTVAVLAERNGIADPNRIEVGQVLRLTDDAPQPLGLRRVAFAEAASLSTRLNAEIRKLIEEAAP